MAVPRTPFVADRKGLLTKAREFVFRNIAAQNMSFVETKKAQQFARAAKGKKIDGIKDQAGDRREFFTELERLTVNNKPPEEAFFKVIHRGPAVAEFRGNGAGIKGRHLMGIVIEGVRVVITHIRAREGERNGIAVEDDQAKSVAKEAVEHWSEMVGSPAGFDDAGGGELFFPLRKEGREGGIVEDRSERFRIISAVVDTRLRDLHGNALVKDDSFAGKVRLKKPSQKGTAAAPGI